MYRKLFSGLVLLLSMSYILTAQEVIATSGDYLESGDMSIQFTIGELATETLNNDEVTITQGFNQPTFTITSIEDNPLVNIDIEVFPNPVAEILSLKIDKPYDDIRWVLFDIDGKQIKKGELENGNQIEFQEFSQGTYILTVMKEDNMIESFRVIKK